MRMLFFLLAIGPCDSRGQDLHGSAKLSVVRRLRWLRQPELWLHNHSTVYGCLERERRLL